MCEILLGTVLGAALVLCQSFAASARSQVPARLSPIRVAIIALVLFVGYVVGPRWFVRLPIGMFVGAVGAYVAVLLWRCTQRG